MADRVNIAQAERDLKAAGYTVDREQHPNVNGGDPVFLAVRMGRGMPTKLEVHRTTTYGLAVSHRTVKRLLSRSSKPEQLPPGHYDVVIDRVRKVRGKPQHRVHMTVLGDGRKLTDTINEEPDDGC